MPALKQTEVRPNVNTMADEAKVTHSMQSLTCLLCVGTIIDATDLSCGHSFCRACLKRYDASYPERDHIVCPDCKELTRLSDNRIDGLPSNSPINELVGEHSRKADDDITGANPQCNTCELQENAVCLCSSCNNFMCEQCLECHQHLKRVFGSHDIIYFQDTNSNSPCGQYPSRFCSTHILELNSIFCEKCVRYICLKCVFNHRDHNLKKSDQFVSELREKVEDLSERTKMKKARLQRNMKQTVLQMQNVQSLVKELRVAEYDAYKEKEKKLRENHQVLVAEIDALEQDFLRNLSSLKESDRQRIRSICSKASLINSCIVGCLETNSLSTHALFCEELETMLETGIDDDTAVTVAEMAKRYTFQSLREDNTLELGHITMTSSPTQLHVTKSVSLCGQTWGITKYSSEDIAVGYWGDHCGIDIIDSSGHSKQYRKFPPFVECCDLVFQEDGTLYASTTKNEVCMYSAKGYWESTIAMESDGYLLALNRSPSDEILLTNGSNQIYIYDSTGTNVEHTVQTKYVTLQVSGTSTGLVVASCSRTIEPDVVVVYDRNGNGGKLLDAPKNSCLYPTVDQEDRVYIASVNCETGRMKITRYVIEGLDLRETSEFIHTDFVLLQHGWCCLVALSPNNLAFACNDKVHFITVSI
ncbi:E3 ubiquitin-protein ligase TRIM33-like isoform X2 [Lytechinus pictus]|uniref:E3 ubiquitin-protein ligase TRIM33-like isoform X2 n=1 Tax=Lytechinus pictus TaxID=7653 RepID=UPI0030B9D504